MSSDLTLREMLDLRRAEQGGPEGTPIADPDPDSTETPSSPQDAPTQADIEVSDGVMSEINSSTSQDGYIAAIGKGLVNGGIRAGESMAKLLAGAMNLPIKGFGAVTGKDTGFEFNAPEPSTFESNTVTQDVTTVLTQYGIGFYSGGQILKGAGLLQGTSGLAKFGNTMAKSVYADFTAFKGDEQRLSDVLVTINNPIANNAVSQYLAGDPDDSDVEGRFKNVLEGAGLGIMTDALFYSVKGIAKGKKALLKGGAEDATKIMDEAKAKIEQVFEANKGNLPDEEAIKNINPVKYNVNKNTKVLDAEKAKEIVTSVKTFKDWAGEDVYKYLDTHISGVVKKELFETTDDVAVAMDFLNDVTVPDFDVWPHQARVDMARTYGMTVDELQQLKNLGAVSSHAMIVSKSMLVDQASVIAKAIEEGVSDEKMLIEMARYKDLSDIFLSFRNESGRVLDSNRIKNAVDVGDADIIDRYLAESFGNKAGFDKFKLAFKATGGDAGEVAALFKKSKIQIASDSALELWKNSILSGIRTFNVNLLGGIVNSTMQIPIRAFEGLAGTMRGGPDRVYIGEAASMAVADVMSFMDLLHSSARMIKNPKNFIDNIRVPHSLVDKTETGFVQKISADYWGMSTKPGATARFVQNLTNDRISAQTVQNAMRTTVNTVGNVINTPAKLMNIQDGFIQNHAMRKEKYALIYRKLMSEGVKPSEFGKKFHELMDDAEFAKQIEPQMRKFAKRVTFQEELGPIGKAVDAFRKNRVTPLKIPVFEYLLPFVRTPANIMKQGLGEINPVVAPMTKDFWDKLSGAQGGVARDQAFGRFMFGSSVAGLASTMTIGGNLTGAGPQEPDMRRAWLAAGNIPYAVRVQVGSDPNGNPIYKSYEYGRLEPFSFLIGSIATAIETHHYTSMINDKSEKTFSQYVGAVVTALNTATLDKSFFTGPQDFFLFMADPERYGPQWMNRFGTSFIPNISRDIEIMLQDKVYLRDFREFDNALNQKLIGGSSKVPVTRNRWGDPIYRDKGWFLGLRTYFSPIGMDEGYAEDIDREIQRLSIEGVPGADGQLRTFPEAMISMPDRAIMRGGVNIRLSAEQYSRLLEIAGQEIKADSMGIGTPMTLRDNLNYLVTKSQIYKAAAAYPATQARLIKEVSKGYDDAAREQLILEYPDLQKKVQEAEYLNLKAEFGVMNEEMRLKALELMGDELQ